MIYSRLYHLFIIQFFTWLGLFSLWIYATPAIAKQYFANQNLENAVQWVGIYFAFYSLLGAFLSLILNKLLKIYSKYLIHSICLLIGSLGFVSIYILESKNLLFLSFILIGISWASISTTPYSMVSNLAQENESEKYFSIFNFSTVIPQVVASFLLSFLSKKIFGGDMMKVILFGGICLFVASVISFAIFLRKKLSFKI